MKKKKLNLTTLLLVVVLVAGLSLLLYPTVSDYWNSMHQSQAISQYAAEVADLDSEQYQATWSAAQSYNAQLLDRSTGFALTEEQVAEYEQMLDISGRGIMGYVEIPEIDCSLPIYHGTDEAVLQVAVGHLEWSSLPVGGESTHCVLSGHRGLPSARLFTNLDKLVIGDIFVLRVLDEVLTYEIDQILTVEPEDTQALLVEEGKDLCTLITCTPYGINSHRLLVRGHRIDNLAASTTIRVTADATQLEPLTVAPILAAAMLLLWLVPTRLIKRFRGGRRF